MSDFNGEQSAKHTKNEAFEGEQSKEEKVEVQIARASDIAIEYGDSDQHGGYITDWKQVFVDEEQANATEASLHAVYANKTQFMIRRHIPKAPELHSVHLHLRLTSFEDPSVIMGYFYYAIFDVHKNVIFVPKVRGGVHLKLPEHKHSLLPTEPEWFDVDKILSNLETRWQENDQNSVK